MEEIAGLEVAKKGTKAESSKRSTKASVSDPRPRSSQSRSAHELFADVESEDEMNVDEDNRQDADESSPMAVDEDEPMGEDPAPASGAAQDLLSQNTVNRYMTSLLESEQVRAMLAAKGSTSTLSPVGPSAPPEASAARPSELRGDDAGGPGLASRIVAVEPEGASKRELRGGRIEGLTIAYLVRAEGSGAKAASKPAPRRVVRASNDAATSSADAPSSAVPATTASSSSSDAEVS